MRAYATRASGDLGSFSSARLYCSSAAARVPDRSCIWAITTNSSTFGSVRFCTASGSLLVTGWLPEDLTADFTPETSLPTPLGSSLAIGAMGVLSPPPLGWFTAEATPLLVLPAQPDAINPTMASTQKLVTFTPSPPWFGLVSATGRA